MIGTYLLHGWLHFFMLWVDYKLFGTGWCMVDALVYSTYLVHGRCTCLWYRLIIG
jgi:hypothetical protein